MNLDWSVVWEYRYHLLQGAGVTVLLTALTMAVSIPGGLLIAAARMSPNRVLNLIAVVFTEFFRNVPLILLVYWAFYVIPIAFDWQISGFATALVALSLNVSAYNAETFRAGMMSIRKGQMEAAMAVGMSRAQALRKVIIPQATTRVLPILASTWVSLFKDTSIVSVITVNELAHTSMQIRSMTFRVLEVLTAMAMLYWLMGYPQAKLVDWIHRKYAVKE